MIPFCRPFVGVEELNEIAKTLKKGWLTTGKVTEEVESMIAEYTGAKYCILLNSCTAALALCLNYLKFFQVGQDFRAYVPSLTFAATATEVLHAGGKIIFGDVDKKMCLNPDTERSFEVAIPVNLCGVEARLNYDTPVIVDSAHLIKKNQCKGRNEFYCYSFYATKNLTMGEGGAICTNSEHAANWFKQARHHGISKGGWERYQKLSKWQYDIEFIGWKCNPSDILAAILLANFKKIDEIHKERQRCVALYNKMLGYKNEGLHLYPVLVENRDEFINLMSLAEIQCSVHFLPLHKMSAFKRSKQVKENNLYNTEYLGEHLVSLPLFPELKNNEIEKICQIILKSGQLLSQ